MLNGNSHLGAVETRVAYLHLVRALPECARMSRGSNAEMPGLTMTDGARGAPRNPERARALEMIRERSGEFRNSSRPVFLRLDRSSLGARGFKLPPFCTPHGREI